MLTIQAWHLRVAACTGLGLLSVPVRFKHGRRGETNDWQETDSQEVS